MTPRESDTVVSAAAGTNEGNQELRSRSELTAKEVMREVGIDISAQWSKSVMEYLGKTHFSNVITVCADAEENCPAVFLNMGIHDHWPFDDPAKFEEGTRLDSTRRVRDQIEQRLRLWLIEQGITPADYRQM